MLQLFPVNVFVKIEGASVHCTNKSEVERVKGIKPSTHSKLQ